MATKDTKFERVFVGNRQILVWVIGKRVTCRDVMCDGITGIGRTKKDAIKSLMKKLRYR